MKTRPPSRAFRILFAVTLLVATTNLTVPDSLAAGGRQEQQAPAATTERVPGDSGAASRPRGPVSEADRQRLVRADATWTYSDSDFSAEYRIVQDRPGQGRSVTVAAVFRRDRNDIYTIVILEPAADRGQGYLKQGDTLWVYDPESGQFNRTSSRDRFQNTNARNSDFTRSTLASDYQIISVAPERLGGFDAYLYELESDRDGVTFPIMRVWITDDGRILKTEDFSRSGQHLRSTAVPGYRRVAGRFVPEQIFIIDELEGALIDGEFVSERTIITVRDASFDAVPDSVFTRSFLERIRR